jgi:hypothetical protein
MKPVSETVKAVLRPRSADERQPTGLDMTSSFDQGSTPLERLSTTRIGRYPEVLVTGSSSSRKS